MNHPGPDSVHTPSWDVLIIGGGVVGSAIAYFLAAGDPGRMTPGNRVRALRIAVVERDPTYARASSSFAVGGIRQQFSTPENVLLSRFSVEFLRRAPELLAVDSERPDVGLVERGYLFLAGEEGLPALKKNLALQTGLGASIAILDPGELKARFPWMQVRDLAGGSLGLEGEGWLDPHSLLHAFKAKARSLGVTYLPDDVVAMRTRNHRVETVSMASGATYPVGLVVNAAGPGAAEVARMAGIHDLPVRPRKRFVYRIHCREPLPECPMVIDTSGVFFRPEGDGYLCGTSPAEDEDPDTLDLEMEFDLFYEVVWPALAHRVPALEAVRLGSSWAGHYAVNTLDHNAILGPYPDLPNFCLANGFSGHGLQHSPGVGMALSELILYGEYRTLNLDRFGFERVERGEPIREANVI